MTPAEALLQQNTALKAEIEAFKQEIGVLKTQIDWLRQKLFGGGQSESMDRAQMLLKLDSLEKLAASMGAPKQITYERQPPKARPLPAETFANLPIKETIEVIPPEVQAEPDKYERIGEERTFEVDITQPQLFKREIVRPKYRLKADRSQPPVLARAPARPVAGGYASAGLLAWVALSKYVDHAPLHRLEQMSARWGARLSRQSMCDWIELTAYWLEPIYRRMLARLRAGGYLQADETPLRCHDPDEKRGTTTQGWLWVISRPGDDVVFDWRLSRRHGELSTLLKDYRGILQSDGYQAYRNYTELHPEVTWVGCWAHARRYFFEAQAESPQTVRVVLKLIARLYRREREWDQAGITEPAARAQKRKEGFARSLKWLNQLARAVREDVRPQSLLGKACDYLLGHWEPLTAHLNHGQTRIDNNLIENAIRPSAIGKKNWLFIGHPDAGQRSAIIYSIVVSCQRHGHDPLAYLRDVLTRLPGMTNQDDLDALLPVNWRPAA
jgi:transposase